MKLEIDIEIDDMTLALEAHSWWLNGLKHNTTDKTLTKAKRMTDDLEREAKFRAEQYLRNIVTMYETRPR